MFVVVLLARDRGHVAISAGVRGLANLRGYKKIYACRSAGIERARHLFYQLIVDQGFVSDAFCLDPPCKVGFSFNIVFPEQLADNVMQTRRIRFFTLLP
ncbi:Uncharacterised protein [BD1-7 clade bacterium]|uniref:Uncharacterized protein n=1 Tax=BD1-7 clade bacterium TaxID=2029982 RepID=A0A5S9PJ54_9GAMM|nr:Uncharacterised protein [BD1-7 clade bacterium]